MPSAESGRNVSGIGASFSDGVARSDRGAVPSPSGIFRELVLVGHVLWLEGRHRTAGRLAIGLLRDGAGRTAAKTGRTR